MRIVSMVCRHAELDAAVYVLSPLQSGIRSMIGVGRSIPFVEVSLTGQKTTARRRRPKDDGQKTTARKRRPEDDGQKTTARRRRPKDSRLKIGTKQKLGERQETRRKGDMNPNPYMLVLVVDGVCWLGCDARFASWGRTLASMMMEAYRTASNRRSCLKLNGRQG